MGDELLDLNYWVVFVYLILFLIFILLNNNLFNKINLFIFASYSVYYIFFGKSYNDLFAVILMYSIVGILHLSLCLVVNVFAKRKKGSQNR